jgi:hypothetical protein
MNTTKIAEWATILGLGISGLWWLFTLDSRVSQLEKQISNNPSSRSQATVPPQSSPSPFEQACADLARKAAEATANADFVIAGQIELQFDHMKCGPPKQQ